MNKSVSEVAATSNHLLLNSAFLRALNDLTQDDKGPQNNQQSNNAIQFEKPKQKKISMGENLESLISMISKIRDQSLVMGGRIDT